MENETLQDFTDLNMVWTYFKTNNIDLVLCENPTNPGLKIIDLKRDI